MKNTSLEEFYDHLNVHIPLGISKEIGHFNIFDTGEIYQKVKEKGEMPYNKRAYYKISLIHGKNRAEYADKVIQIEQNALLFATPKIPYNYIPENGRQAGQFCIFTEEFFTQSISGIVLDEFPIFMSGGYPVFELKDEEIKDISHTFSKMSNEISSDYAFKYDLLRTYVLELIHYGQKLQPAATLHPTHNAAVRVTSLFIELLERQFPIESPQQKLKLRSARDFADHLAIHVNHLNKVLKENTGITTTHFITKRILQEAKILLKQTNWSVSEIAYCLGFEEVAHFSNFFKKQTDLAPFNYRNCPQ
ncbi:helix-turn-helix transcriptional regulator [Reichenbachiella agarivorans]|uniref:Helix-turn-helix transcriptional regulator n=1 Tax=Reichenbachiella agarivorans TaxID=2979464 RepID=A0ABY6CPE3_9BACT|nr:helix-turn-helix transcriptional regulator [Reichenbachiella agarivorans]UXP31228.1 helix-turn-helix transcriptional regulator [Reichenbachiella agarivorans]